MCDVADEETRKIKQNYDAAVTKFSVDTEDLKEANINLEKARAEKVLADQAVEEILASSTSALPYGGTNVSNYVYSGTPTVVAPDSFNPTLFSTSSTTTSSSSSTSSSTNTPSIGSSTSASNLNYIPTYPSVPYPDIGSYQQSTTSGSTASTPSSNSKTTTTTTTSTPTNSQSTTTYTSGSSSSIPYAAPSSNSQAATTSNQGLSNTINTSQFTIGNYISNNNPATPTQSTSTSQSVTTQSSSSSSSSSSSGSASKSSSSSSSSGGSYPITDDARRQIVSPVSATSGLSMFTCDPSSVNIQQFEGTLRGVSLGSLVVVDSQNKQYTLSISSCTQLTSSSATKSFVVGAKVKFTGVEAYTISNMVLFNAFSVHMIPN